MDSQISVSIITATLNERGNVKQFVERVHKAMGRSKYEIIVVDDNSTDETIEQLESVAREYPYLTVKANPQRVGLLKSNLMGIKESRGEYKIVMDADLQHPPEKIKDAVDMLSGGVDCVVMSRFVDGSRVERREHYRSVATSMAIALCHLLVPQTKDFRDPISGFFAMGRNVEIPYDRLFSCFGGHRGYKVLVPIIANNEGKKFTELPYSFNSRYWGESKIGRENLLIPRYITELRQYRSMFKEPEF